MIYVVRPGDTLAEIARRYNTTVEAIMRANGLTNTTIYIGQRLFIPISSQPFPPGPPFPGPIPGPPFPGPGPGPGPVPPQWAERVERLERRVNQIERRLTRIEQQLQIRTE